MMMGITFFFLEVMEAEAGCAAGWRKAGMDGELGVCCSQGNATSDAVLIE